jgi:acyl carrier protein
MPDEKLRARVRALLAEHCGTSEASLNDRSNPQNTPGWDSAANLNFVAAIEDEFDVTIATRDAIRLRSLGDFTAYLEAHTQAGNAARGAAGR